MIAYNFKHKLFLLTTLCLGIALLLFLNNISRGRVNPYFCIKRLPSSSDRLLSPLLLVETSQGNDPRLESAKDNLEKYIKTHIDSGDVSSAAVYLRDLNNGTWIGINEEEIFAAASLIKIPLIMAYLKKAEEDPAILNKTIKYEASADIVPQNIRPQNSIKLGNAYTVDELLDYMVLYSDNTAMELLFKNIDEKVIAELLSDLQLPALHQEAEGPEYKISAKDCAVLFRVLYNATYLNKDLSKKALKLLTSTKFSEGIVAGVPTNITVAHKFAERAYMPTNEKQLHDCGIVYCEKRPYLICVMTKGWDFNTLKGIIKEISKIIYRHMEEAIVVY